MRPRFTCQSHLRRFLAVILTAVVLIVITSSPAAPNSTNYATKYHDLDPALFRVENSFSRTFASNHLEYERLALRLSPRSKTHPTPQLTSQSDTRRLNPGQLIERTIIAGEMHNYEIALEAGQYLRVAVNPHGSYISVGLSGSGVHLVGEAFKTETQGRRIWAVADTTDVYMLQISTIGSHAIPKRYGISIEELRQATALEKEAQAARIKRNQAVKLYLENTAESLPKALELFKETLIPLRAVGDTWNEALTLYLTAATYNGLGEYQKAIDACNESLPLCRTFGDSFCMGTLTVMGESYYYLSDYQKALDSYFEAMRVARTWPGYRIEDDGWPLNNIGSVYDALGEKHKALDYYSQGLVISRKVLNSDYGRNRGIGIGLTNIGGVYVSLGQPQKALECFEEALPHWRAAGDLWGEARVYHRLGLVYELLGDRQAALDRYSQALPIWRKTADRWNEALTLNNIGIVYGSLKDYPRAVDHLNQALKIRRELGYRNGEATTLYHIAAIERDRGNPAIARERIEDALAIIEDVRTRFVDQELRFSFSVTVHQYYEFYIDLLMQLHQQDLRAGFDAAALQASERARVRTLIEMLMEARADIRQGVDPVLVEREQNLQRRLNERAAYRDNLVAKGRDAQDVGKELEQILTDLQQARAQLKSASPKYTALTQPEALKVSEIQQQVLDANTMLLEYALGEKTSYVWVVSNDSIASVALPSRAVIESEARKVYDLLTARSRRPKGETAQQRRIRIAGADREYTRAALRLSRMILGPVGPLLGKKRLLVVADGALQYIPFPALPVPAGNRPLIADHEIVNLPSASTLAVLRRELADRQPANKAVAVLADPVFSADDPRVLSHSASKGSSVESAKANPGVLRDLQRALRDVSGEDLATGLPRLYATRFEAEQLKRLVEPAERLIVLDFDASRETAASAELSDYRIIHFASHALIDTKHPELSGIVLSLVDERGQPRDGFLRAHEIYNLRLPAELVVLNACRTGLGKEVRGEGLIGLTRGFMYAGAARVLVSLWSIDDRASAELMKRMYKKMLGRERLSPAAALRAAQVELWRKGSTSPYYWAGFSLQGEWR